MLNSQTQAGYAGCLATLEERLREPAPGRIQMLVGPRQVGKTTILLWLLDKFAPDSRYVPVDGAETLLPGYWDRFWNRVEGLAENSGPVVVLLDEVQQWAEWAERLKAIWDRHRRRRLAVHIVLTGSSALLLGKGARESLAGRFEKTFLTHWGASAIGQAFEIQPHQAAQESIWWGGYPGAWAMRHTPARWAAYVRDAIIEPVLGRDIVALSNVRKPALMRQIFAVASALPAQNVSLAKLQGSLQSGASLATVADYLMLLEQSFLIASIPKYAEGVARRRKAPPKLVVLNNAILGATAWQELPQKGDPQYGRWVENACLAHAYNSEQQVFYWREGDQEIDLISSGTWGHWAIEIKTGDYAMADLNGLGEFLQRNNRFAGLVVCDSKRQKIAQRAGFDTLPWEDYLLGGPPLSPTRSP
jgi:predicted AAA+ superfamily ATPase